MKRVSSAGEGTSVDGDENRLELLFAVRAERRGKDVEVQAVFANRHGTQWSGGLHTGIAVAGSIEHLVASVRRGVHESFLSNRSVTEGDTQEPERAAITVASKRVVPGLDRDALVGAKGALLNVGKRIGSRYGGGRRSVGAENTELLALTVRADGASAGLVGDDIVGATVQPEGIIPTDGTSVAEVVELVDQIRANATLKRVVKGEHFLADACADLSSAVRSDRVWKEQSASRGDVAKVILIENVDWTKIGLGGYAAVGGSAITLGEEGNGSDELASEDDGTDDAAESGREGLHPGDSKLSILR